MSVHSWSGTVTCLLVLCLTAGCAASQQQQQPAALLGVTTDEFLSFMSRAFQAELQPILSRLEARVKDLDRKLEARVEDLDRKLESRVEDLGSKLEAREDLDRKLEVRVEDLDRKLEARVEDLDRKLEARVEDLDRKLEARVENVQNKLILLDPRFGALDNKLFTLDKRVDELTVQLWNSTQQSQLNKISNRIDSQQVRLDEMSTELDNQTSRLQTLYTRQDGQESRVVGLATHLDRLQSQLAVLTNSTTAVQSRVDGLTNSTTGVQSRVDGAANETAGQQPQADEVTSRPDQAEGIDQPRDCSELPPGTTSGVYRVWPDHSQDPVQAFCQEDSDGGKTWTVFQRRDDIQPRQDFFLGWDSYKRGFGNLTREFWWGLEHLHKLTSAQDRPYQLRIDLEAFDGGKAHALYSTFRVSTEEEDYRLTVYGYTGDAGDSLSSSSSRMFSTRDRDNDPWPGVSCTEWYQGAWWYGLGCGDSSLNGRYLEDGREDWTGIWWFKWRYWESLKKVQMMLRPA